MIHEVIDDQIIQLNSEEILYNCEIIEKNKNKKSMISKLTKQSEEMKQTLEKMKVFLNDQSGDFDKFIFNLNEMQLLCE